MDRDALRAWLADRLTSDRARDDWTRLVEAGWDELRARPLAEVLPRASLDAIVAAELTPDRLAELVRPAAGAVLRDLMADLRAEPTKVGHWVPAGTQARIEKLVMRPGAVDPDAIRAMFREKAVEVMLADTLTVTIRDFSTMIPKLVLNLMPKGPFGVLGGASALGTKLVEEVEKRLEPEIRTFLQSGTKKALERAAEFAVSHTDDPTSVEFRRNAVRFVLGRTPRELARPLDDVAVAEIGVIADEIARHVAALPETRARVAATLDRFYQRYGAGSVGAALDAHGLTARPPLAAFAEATWPLVKSALTFPAAAVWRDALLDELLAQLPAPPSAAS